MLRLHWFTFIRNNSGGHKRGVTVRQCLTWLKWKEEWSGNFKLIMCQLSFFLPLFFVTFCKKIKILWKCCNNLDFSIRFANVSIILTIHFDFVLICVCVCVCLTVKNTYAMTRQTRSQLKKFFFCFYLNPSK